MRVELDFREQHRRIGVVVLLDEVSLLLALLLETLAGPVALLAAVVTNVVAFGPPASRAGRLSSRPFPRFLG
jgi:hypothetical protein